MNRIVKEHYPVDRLPEELREGFEAGSFVRVTLVVHDERTDEELLMDLDKKLDKARADIDSGLGLSSDEVLRSIETHEAKWLAKTR